MFAQWFGRPGYSRHSVTVELTGHVELWPDPYEMTRFFVELTGDQLALHDHRGRFAVGVHAPSHREAQQRVAEEFSKRFPAVSLSVEADLAGVGRTYLRVGPDAIF